MQRDCAAILYLLFFFLVREAVVYHVHGEVDAPASFWFLCSRVTYFFPSKYRLQTVSVRRIFLCASCALMRGDTHIGVLLLQWLPSKRTKKLHFFFFGCFVFLLYFSCGSFFFWLCPFCESTCTSFSVVARPAVMRLHYAVSCPFFSSSHFAPLLRLASYVVRTTLITQSRPNS